MPPPSELAEFLFDLRGYTVLPNVRHTRPQPLHWAEEREFNVQLTGLQALSSEELDAINGWVDRLGPIVCISASLSLSLSFCVSVFLALWLSVSLPQPQGRILSSRLTTLSRPSLRARDPAAAWLVVWKRRGALVPTPLNLSLER